MHALALLCSCVQPCMGEKSDALVSHVGGHYLTKEKQACMGSFCMPSFHGKKEPTLVVDSKDSTAVEQCILGDNLEGVQFENFKEIESRPCKQIKSRDLFLFQPRKEQTPWQRIFVRVHFCLKEVGWGPPAEQETLEDRAQSKFLVYLSYLF